MMITQRLLTSLVTHVYCLLPAALRRRLGLRVPVQTRSPNLSSRLLPRTVVTTSTPRRSEGLPRSVRLSRLDCRSLPSPAPVPTPPFIELQVTPKSWSTMMEGTKEIRPSPLMTRYKKDHPVRIISIRARRHSGMKMIMGTMMRRINFVTLNQSLVSLSYP